MDLHAQSARRTQLVDKFCRFARDCYATDDATFHGPYTEPDERDRFRAAAVLLAHGGEAERHLAESLIRHAFGGPDNDCTRRSLEENIVDLKAGNVRDWNIFQSNIATGILAHDGERVAADVREKLRRIAARNCSRFAGSAQPDYMFHGANDNMPAHATCGLILAGEAIGNEQAIDDGIYRLQLFAELLSRRGLCSEFASGTYLALTISAMAELVELAREPLARELALAIEHQLWADIVGHYHPGSGKAAGPQTRAYTVNSVAHLDSLMVLLWCVTGEPPFTDPVRDLITMQEKQVTHFEGDALKTAGGVVYLMLPDYHFPEHLAPLLTERSYPFRMVGTAEQMYGGAPDVGGREVQATSWQQADYSLASVTHGFLTGNQTEKLRLTFRHVEEPASFRDTGVVYWRYLYNDEAPGQPVQEPNCAPGEAGLLPDRALVTTLQHDNLALLVSRGWHHAVDIPETFTRLRLATIIPAHYRDARAIWIGDRELPELTGESAAPEPVFVDLGRLWLALVPLAMSDHGRQAITRVDREGDYRTISFFNYEGDARELDIEALKETFNGLLVKAAGPGEYASFEAFRAAFRLQLLEDWYMINNRRTRALIDGHELLLNWCPQAGTVRCATIDGREPPRHRLRATGMQVERFPLLGDYQPRVGHLHYDDLTIAWYPHLHWQIGQRRGGSAT